MQEAITQQIIGRFSTDDIQQVMQLRGLVHGSTSAVLNLAMPMAALNAGEETLLLYAENGTNTQFLIYASRLACPDALWCWAKAGYDGPIRATLHYDDRVHLPEREMARAALRCWRKGSIEVHGLIPAPKPNLQIAWHNLRLGISVLVKIDREAGREGSLVIYKAKGIGRPTAFDLFVDHAVIPASRFKRGENLLVAYDCRNEWPIGDGASCIQLNVTDAVPATSAMSH